MVTYDERDRIGGAPYISQKLSIGGTIRDTASVIGRAWGSLYGLAVIVAVIGLPAAYMFSKIMTKSAVPQVNPRASVDPIFLKELGAVFAVQILFSLYAYAVMGRGARNVLEEGRFDLGSALRVGLARYLPMLLSALLLYVMILIGSVLLLVPGIMAGAIYGLAPTLCVIERRGPFASFSRSADLTRGNRWRCFGVTLIILLVPGIIQFAANAGIVVLVGPQYNLIVSSLTGILVMPIFYVFPTALAHRLKLLRDGGAPSGVADVF